MTAKPSLHGADRLFQKKKQNKSFEGVPHRVALWVAIVVYCILAVMGRAVNWQQKFVISHSYNGGSISLTIQQDMDYSDPSLVTLRTVKVKTGNTTEGTVGVTATNTALNGSNQDTYVDTGSTPGTTTSSSFTHAKATSVTFQKYRVIVGQGVVVDGSSVYTPNGTTVTYKVTFTLPANTTTAHIKYNAYQGATQVGSFVTAPGDPAVDRTLYGLSSNTAVTLKEEKANLIVNPDGTAYFDTNTFVREVNGGTVPVQDTETASPASVTGPGQTTSTGVAPTQNVTTNNYSSTTVWSSASGTAPIGGSTQIVTDSLYKEGTGKVIEAVNSVRQSVDVVKDNTQVIKEHAEAQLALRDSSPTVSDMDTAGAAYSASMLSGMSAIQAKRLDQALYSVSPASILVMDLPVIGVVNLDPASNAQIAAYLLFLKRLCGWFFFAQFSWWAMREFKSIMFAAASMTQAKGNTVLAGTGAQATALIAAGVICGLFIAIPATYWLMVDPAWVDTEADNPFSSATTIVAAALYLLSLCLPYQLLLLLWSEMFVIRKAGIILFSTTHMIVKAVVP